MSKPDIEAIITCHRNNPFFDGYRPVHLIKDDYLKVPLIIKTLYLKMGKYYS